MKKSAINAIKWLAVFACSVISLILLMAEPISENEPDMAVWMMTFVAMKFGAVICGVVALALAGKLNEIVKAIGKEE